MSQITATAASPAPAEDEKELPSRRVRIAEWVAFVGLIAAFIGALGPADRLHATYSWPSDTPASSAVEGLYTPLLLASRIPEEIELTVPCRVRASRDSAPTIVMATARHPQRTGALLVTHDGEALSIRVGNVLLAQLVDDSEASRPSQCVRALEIKGGRWSLSDPAKDRTLGGRLRRMPVVNGLFTELVANASPRPKIDVTTRPHGVATTWRQTLAWIVAFVCGLGSLLLVTSGIRRPWWRDMRTLPRRCARALHPVDVFVAALLLVWWLIAPAFFDDGWSIARQSAFATAGNFSNYYESFGVSLPLGYWLEWLQQWITRSTDSLVVMRVPTLFCLAAIWLTCRWIFAQICGSFRSWTSAAPWALAFAFAGIVTAWGLSLRQEPAVALLTTGVIACCVRFAQTRSSAAIALAAVLVPLALTAHPTGIVAIAPVIAIAPECFRWARVRPADAVTILTASGALALALAFIGSDVAQRALDAQTLGTFSTTIVDWRDELGRYSVLTGREADYVGYAAPLRRCAVALLLLACLAYLLRSDRRRHVLLDLPARALVVSLVLFIATPSKWPWHFGALVGVATLAVAAETVRWREEMRPSPAIRSRTVIALSASILAALWSWWPRGAWNAVDLRTLDWTPSFERFVPLTTAAALLPLALVAVGVVVSRLRHTRAADVPSSVVSWTAPILVLPLVVFTVSILVADGIRTPGWTAARENIAALRGTDGCGFADDLRVPALDSIRPLPTTQSGRKRSPTPDWAPPAPAPGLTRFALGPTLESTSTTPWFVAPHARIGLFVSGRPAPGDRLEVQWGVRRDGANELVRRDSFPVRPTTTEEASPWRLITQPELRRPPRRATIVRVLLENDAPPAAAIVVTEPFRSSLEPLTQALAADGLVTLALPHVVTFFPCVALPKLQHGVVSVPDVILTTRAADPLLLDPGTSPFNGLLDIYSLQRLAVTDSRNKPSEVTVHTIDPRIRGWERVEPDQT